MQKKYWVAIGVAVVIIGLSVGGYLLVPGTSNSSVHDGLGTNFDDHQSAQAAAGGTNSSNVPLTSTSGGGLNTSSTPSSGNLGQLSQPQNSGSGSSSTTSSPGNLPSVDPSTFAQYDKYKTYTQGVLLGDLRTGSGTALSSGHQAIVYYKGWLTNGQLFDQSRPGSDGQLQPFTFTLGQHQVISGWEDGLAGMKVGGTRLLVIPPAFGYGPDGQSPIPGNAVLVFEVQLLAVQ
jgi:FKBP-type peptidyl-prolyl cis-trans isomerase FkpA